MPEEEPGEEREGLGAQEEERCLNARRRYPGIVSSMRPQLSPASSPYDFSPATTAALVALVASKADNGVFSITYQQPTLSRFTGDSNSLQATPGQLAPFGFPPSITLLVQPVSPATARLYSWSATYRGRTQGGQLCADAAQDTLAQGLLAQQALGWMNAIDLRYPVAPTPNATPDVAGLALDFRGRIIGKLLGYTGPKVTQST